MSKLILFAALIALIAVMACGGEDTTEVPADTPEPQPTAAPTTAPEPTSPPAPANTPEPTATPQPTAAPQPTAKPDPTAKPRPTDTPVPQPTEPPAPAPTEEPTQAPAPQQPEAEAEPGQLTPLVLDNPIAAAQEFSEGELACLAGTSDTGRLMQIFSNPELASPEEQSQFINCLEDETLTRLFLTGLIGDTGPLSIETSDCIRSGMEGVDLRSVMLAGSGGDEQAAMVGSMSALFLSLSCLNDEEFAAAGPALGMTPDDRESLECVIEQLGGAEGFAEVFTAEDGSGIMSLFGAAMGCGLQMEGGMPSMGSDGMGGFPYDSCEEADAAGEFLIQGSEGDGWGFPSQLVPNAIDDDGDGVVCER